MTLYLRPAHPADATATAAIMSAWIDDTPWVTRIHTHAEDRAFVSGLIVQGEVTLAQDGNQILGFLGRAGTEVNHMFVALTARRRGVGATLIKHAQAESDDLRLWCFQANTDALRFYASHGFAEDHRTDGASNEERMPDVRLTWRTAKEAV